MRDNILNYCYYCKGVIQPWDRFRATEQGLIHNNDNKDCYAITQLAIDECGDLIDEE